jgi:AbrB family looped-hinge helix DNA binding protein
MASSVKMSSKNQIVVPREARDALGLRSGDRLLVDVRDDGVLEMRRQPSDPAGALEGTLPVLPADGELWPEARGE